MRKREEKGWKQDEEGLNTVIGESYERGNKANGFPRFNSVMDFFEVGSRKVYKLHIIMKL